MSSKTGHTEVLKRITFGILMITGFSLIIYMGPLMIIFLTLTIQVFCFKEVLTIGYKHNNISPTVPHFRSLCWYFLIVVNYFFFIEILAPHFQEFYKDKYYLKTVIRYHRFISFCIYFSGIVLFVVNLVRKYDLKQFRILAWTHTLLLIIVLQSYLLIANVFYGVIWVILPSSLVIINDIFSYVFGRLIGKRPLIQLSPKKTWEGFIGGALSTYVSGFVLSTIMCRYQYFICPVEYHVDGGLQTDCVPKDYYDGFIRYFGIHFLSLTFFASIFAPFGGFCASGFKRAFNIKDFGDAIPGHGGIMDRFDCQFLMATFVNVYLATFVRTGGVELIFSKIMYLDEEHQVEFYVIFKEALLKNNLLNNKKTFT